MGADATINIDVMLANLPKFKNDVSFVDDVLTKLGMNTGSKIDDSFKSETAKIETIAKSMKKDVDQTLDKPVKFTIKADNSDAERDVKETKAFLKDIPKSKITELKADNHGMALKIQSTKDGIGKIPTTKKTVVDLENTEFNQQVETTKKKIVRFPKELKTKIIADAEEQGIKDFDKLLKKLPYEKKVELRTMAKTGEAIDYKKIIAEIPNQKETILDADATQAKSETKELGDTAQKTESKFISLKDKLSIGAVAGIASSAIQVITGSFSDLIGEAIESSDAIDKFRSTMKLGKFGDEEISKAAKEVKKYANETVYDLSTISNTTAQLAANGVKNFTEVTEAAGNLNAQAGGNADNFKAVALAMTQTVGAGKLTTENWNQIADAMQGASGVLQEAMKKNGAYTGNFRDAMEKGEISADEFNKAIVELGMTDGAIKAAKSVETFEGAIGNLRAGIVTGLDDIIKHLGKDKLTGIINGASGSVVGLFQHVSDVFSYLDKNKSTIGNITGNVKDLAGALISGAWDQGKDILLAVADMFGLIDDNTKKIKDPLKQLDKIIENLADNKDKVELLGKALVTMFAVKKGFEFISMINQARKSLLEFTAVEKATSFLSGGGLSFGKKASTKNIGNVGAEIAETILPKGDKGVATIADDALESVSKLGGLAKLSKGVSKVLPFAGVLASATELLGKGSASSKLGAFGGSLGGSAAGAAIGTAILPGIGTAIGAGLGGLGGTELGKNLGKDIGKGFKSYAPNLTNLLGDIGHDITKKFSKNVGSNAKELSKTYTKEMEKLNKIAVKTPKGDKELKKQKAQTTEIFKDMSDSIQKYYKKKEKSSKSDYDYFVKNGLMTQKEADKALAKQKKNDDSQKQNHKKALDSMQVYSDKHYANVEKIEKGGTKKLQDIAKKYGKDSKEYKKELNKELEEEQEKYAKNMSKAQSKLNEQISKETKIASGKQLDILQDLKDHKGKLSHEEMKTAILNSKEQRDTIIKDAKKTANDSITAADKKYKETVEKADKERYENGTMSKKQYDEVVKQAKKERDDAVAAATEKRDKSIKKAQETHKEVVDQATQQAGEHKGAVDGETGEVVGSWGEMKTNMGSIVEAIAHGIGSLINGLNKDWGKDLKNFKFGAHAKGTSGLTEDEIALVGEEGFELAHHPTKGIFAVGSQGPEIRPLQAGTSILPHEASKQFLSMTKGLPAHASGVWGTINNIADWIKEKAESAEEFVFDGADKLYNTVTDKLGISKFLDSLGDSAEFKVAKGGLNTVKDNVIKYAQSLFDKYQEEFGSSGSFDGAMNANGVYDYLVKVAQKVIGKFGNGFYVSSGYRPGDQYHHGQHQAIDIAIPGAILSPLYTKAANYAFEKFPKEVGYVITNGMVRDRMGYTHGGTSGKWVPWGSTDHDNHVHISGRMGSGDIYHGNTNSGGTNAKPTGGHQNWMKQAGFSPSEYAAIDYIVNHESSWNPQAVNASSGAYGLPQSLPASKLASAGSDWRTNPITQLKWMRNYVNERYGGANGALSFWKANHWYANGGEVDKPTLAWIGEDPNYAKEFIINPAKDSADLLIQKAIAAREQYKPTPSAQNYSSNNNSTGRFVTQTDLNQLINKINERPVKVNSILDGKQVGHSVDQTNAGTLKRKLYTARRA